MTKKCPKCAEEKLKVEFYSNRAAHDNLSTYCKVCQNLLAKIRYQSNPSKYINAQKTRMENPSRKASYKEWKDEYNKLYNKEWKSKNRERIRLYEREQRKHNINYKLAQNLRTRIRTAVRRNQKAGSAIEALGCSIEDFKKYLETLFSEDMSWSNYGKWHIDHITPLSSFDLTNPEEFRKACHFSNLQPLWAKDNLSKSDKV